MLRSLLALSSLCLLVPCAAAAGPPPSAPAPGKLPAPAGKTIDFARDIKPVLDRSCVSCHGPEKQRGGLRLDNGLDAHKGGNSGPVLNPGDGAASRLVRVVCGLDPETKM